MPPSLTANRRIGSWTGATMARDGPAPQDGTPPAETPGSFRLPSHRFSIYCAGLSDSAVNSLCGATAGVASGIVTCPLDVIKTRLQAQGSFRRSIRTGTSTGGALYNGMIGTAKTIWSQDGIRGMYRGLGPMLLGYLPTWAVYMSVYDSSRTYYYTHIGKRIYVMLAREAPHLTAHRQCLDRSDLCLGYSWCLLDARHQPNLGHQNPSHVTGRAARSR
jgi:hypothetical protein